MRDLRLLVVAASVLLGALYGAVAHAATAAGLLGEPVRDARGERAGTLSDFIVDVEAGRILYLVLEQDGRHRTLPVRALGEGGRVDLAAGGQIARQDEERAARFRRASALIGRPLLDEYPRATQSIGTIVDIEFDVASGRIERVVVDTDDGRRSFGPELLTGRRLPQR